MLRPVPPGGARRLTGAEVLVDVETVAIDTETTGLDVSTARVVEIGLAFQNGDRHDRTASVLVNPSPLRPEDWREAQKVCGWTEDDLERIYAAPGFDAVAARLAGHLAGRLVVGYNLADYDLPLLAAESARRCGGEDMDRPEWVIDIQTVVRQHLRHLRSRRLSDVYAHLGGEPLRAHRAVADCRMVLYLLHRSLVCGWLPPLLGDAVAVVDGWRRAQDAEWAEFGFWLYRDRQADARLVGEATASLSGTSALDSGCPVGAVADNHIVGADLRSADGSVLSCTCGRHLRLGAGGHCGERLDQVASSHLDWLLRGDVQLTEGAKAAVVAERQQRSGGRR